jgi:hypothetical protein
MITPRGGLDTKEVQEPKNGKTMCQQIADKEEGKQKDNNQQADDSEELSVLSENQEREYQ